MATYTSFPADNLSATNNKFQQNPLDLLLLEHILPLALKEPSMDGLTNFVVTWLCSTSVMWLVSEFPDVTTACHNPTTAMARTKSASRAMVLFLF